MTAFQTSVKMIGHVTANLTYVSKHNILESQEEKEDSTLLSC